MDLDLRPLDLDLTVSESLDSDLEKQDRDLNLQLWDLTTSMIGMPDFYKDNSKLDLRSALYLVNTYSNPIEVT